MLEYSKAYSTRYIDVTFLGYIRPKRPKIAHKKSIKNTEKMRFQNLSLVLFTLHLNLFLTILLPVSCLTGKSHSMQRRIPYDLGIWSPENDDFVFYDKRGGLSYNKR